MCFACCSAPPFLRLTQTCAHPLLQHLILKLSIEEDPTNTLQKLSYTLNIYISAMIQGIFYKSGKFELTGCHILIQKNNGEPLLTTYNSHNNLHNMHHPTCTKRRHCIHTHFEILPTRPSKRETKESKRKKIKSFSEREYSGILYWYFKRTCKEARQQKGRRRCPVVFSSFLINNKTTHEK